MGTQVLVSLSLILILTSGSKGWHVNVSECIFGKVGSDLIIPCAFTYPPEFYTDDVQVYWKISKKSRFEIDDYDKNAFIYHTNDTLVLERYRGKTSIVGNKDEGSCSLMIRGADHNETNLYLRVMAKGNQYSFNKNSVSITLLEFPTWDTALLTATVVMGAMLLMMALFLGVVLGMKYKQEASGYSESSHRPTSNLSNRGIRSELQEKFTDEPIYINAKVYSNQMQPSDDTENIYANVEMSKKDEDASVIPNQAHREH